MTPPPSREAIRARSLPPFRRGRNWTKADIFLWKESGVLMAIKDYAGRPTWIRDTLGRLLVRRECVAYRRLSGLEGIPPFVGRIDPYAFAVGFVEGKDLSYFRRGEVPPQFFDRLLDLLSALHGRGVAHGDLHHRDILMDPSGFPYLVDFSTALLREEGSGRLRRLLFEAASGSDRRAALKLKRRHAPQALTDQENRDLDHPPAWYRMGRGLRTLLGRGGR